MLPFRHDSTSTSDTPNVTYSDEDMQIDSEAEDVKVQDVDADGEYVEDDPMSAIDPPPQRAPSYSRDSVRAIMLCLLFVHLTSRQC
jgi:hypothetical protein